MEATRFGKVLSAGDGLLVGLIQIWDAIHGVWFR